MSKAKPDTVPRGTADAPVIRTLAARPTLAAARGVQVTPSCAGPMRFRRSATGLPRGLGRD